MGSEGGDSALAGRAGEGRDSGPSVDRKKAAAGFERQRRLIFFASYPSRPDRLGRRR
jgi:hypothetical protein